MQFMGFSSLSRRWDFKISGRATEIKASGGEISRVDFFQAHRTVPEQILRLITLPLLASLAFFVLSFWILLEMPSFERFTVFIIEGVSGTPYPEYKTTTTDDRTECYIESKINEIFSIQLDASRSSRFWKARSTFCLHICVDGKTAHKPILGHINGNLNLHHNSEGIHVGSDTYLAYRFAKTEFCGKHSLT